MMILWLILIQLWFPTLAFTETNNRVIETKEIIDLNQYPLFVHAGFSADNTATNFALQDKGWTVLAPAIQGDRSMRIIDIEEFNKHRFFAFTRLRAEEFTYVIPFIVSYNQYSALNKPYNSFLGLHLASIGDNWEVYLNGSRIRSELHRDVKGNIVKHRNYRDVLIPFPSTLLRIGPNTLVFRIIGDPSSPLVGLNSSAPYRIAPYTLLKDAVNNRFDVTLSLIYIFMGIYIFIFKLRKESEKYFRSYGLFSIVLGMYFLARTNAAYQIIADSEVLFKIEISSLFLILPLATTFVTDLSPFSSNKERIFNYLIYTFYFLFIIVALLVPPAVIHDLINIWAILSVLTLIYDYFYLVIWKFFLTLQGLLRRLTTKPTYKDIISAFRETLLNTTIGNVWIGITMLVFSAVVDTYGSLIVKKNLVTSRYSLLFFTLGSIFVIARRYSSRFKELFAINTNLASQIENLRKTNQKIELSQQIYQGIFNGTIDPMLIVDSQFTIQEHNRAAENLFGIVITDGSNLASLLQRFVEPGRILVNELIDIRHKVLIMNMPFEMKINEKDILYFQKISIADSPHMYIRIAKINPLFIRGSFIWGWGTYSLENSLPLAERISFRIGVSIGTYVPDDNRKLLQAAIHEMIRNAIEHGNLEISPQEKAEAVAKQEYNELLYKKAELPAYRNRKVYVTYIVTSKKVLIKITDEGKGFDHQGVLKKAKNSEAAFIENYQGIYFALAAFDRVVYNEKGNQVSLEKSIHLKDTDHESKNIR